MKRSFLKKLSLTFLTAVLFVQLSGCYGSFTVTKKLYNWNGSVGDKFVNTAVMWVMFIIPAYEIAGAADLLIFNTIEFWTGKNPVAMNEGEKETQYVSNDGSVYRVTATQNRFDIVKISGDQAQGQTASLWYDETDGKWYISNDGGEGLLIAEKQAENSSLLTLVYPDQSKLTVDLNQMPPVR